MSQLVYASDMSVRRMSRMNSKDKYKNQYHDSDYESDQGWENESDSVCKFREDRERERERGALMMDVDAVKSRLGTGFYFSDDRYNTLVEPSITAEKMDMKPSFKNLQSQLMD